jgi:hypothetical protein
MSSIKSVWYGIGNSRSGELLVHRKACGDDTSRSPLSMKLSAPYYHPEGRKISEEDQSRHRATLRTLLLERQDFLAGTPQKSNFDHAGFMLSLNQYMELARASNFICFGNPAFSVEILYESAVCYKELGSDITCRWW